MRLFATFLLLLATTTHAAPPPAPQVRGLSLVTSPDLALYSTIGGARLKDRIALGKQVYVTEVSPAVGKPQWVRIIHCAQESKASKGSDCRVWAPVDQVTHESRFVRVKKWSGPHGISMEAGECNVGYTFHRNGTVEYSPDCPSEASADPSGEDSPPEESNPPEAGRLYRYQKFLWAKMPDSHYDELFIAKPGQEICMSNAPEVCASPNDEFIYGTPQGR